MRATAEFWASLLLAIVAAFIIAVWVPGQADQKVVHAIEYAGLVITFLFGFMILAAIASGKIDISRILEEKAGDGGGASMSRFQLLIFTFVVAISLLLIVVNNHDFPKEIPAGVLTLLGISATTYAVSKGIQTGADNGNGNGASAPPPTGGVTHTTVVAPPAGGGSVTHTIESAGQCRVRRSIYGYQKAIFFSQLHAARCSVCPAGAGTCSGSGFPSRPAFYDVARARCGKNFDFSVSSVSISAPPAGPPRYLVVRL